MSYLWRVRVDKEELSRANRVTKSLGTTTQEMVRVLITKIARCGHVPPELGLQNDPANTPWEQRAQNLKSFYNSEGHSTYPFRW